ncbi:hypothetical protein B2J90_29155 (plasmid) [Bacillus tropicus]|uniref:hypothetical protein n=1 Tax=Bacillus tropicus TaxID=2026188 RepID=UPI000A209AA6|nr:hypothetical protein B2J90_29155 [Bacillus cereus]
MSYELMLIPMDYKKHLKGEGTKATSSCIMCGSELALIDEFTNVAGMPQSHTDYEGIFSVCPQCTTPHLELLSGVVDFKGPVLIGWE